MYKIYKTITFDGEISIIFDMKEVVNDFLDYSNANIVNVLSKVGNGIEIEEDELTPYEASSLEEIKNKLFDDTYVFVNVRFKTLDLRDFKIVGFYVAFKAGNVETDFIEKIIQNNFRISYIDNYNVCLFEDVVDTTETIYEKTFPTISSLKCSFEKKLDAREYIKYLSNCIRNGYYIYYCKICNYSKDSLSRECFANFAKDCLKSNELTVSPSEVCLYDVSFANAEKLFDMVTMRSDSSCDRLKFVSRENIEVARDDIVDKSSFGLQNININAMILLLANLVDDISYVVPNLTKYDYDNLNLNIGVAMTNSRYLVIKRKSIEFSNFTMSEISAIYDTLKMYNEYGKKKWVRLWDE